MIKLDYADIFICRWHANIYKPTVRSINEPVTLKKSDKFAAD